MPHYYVDRGKEQASTTGTGDFTVGGAFSGMFVALSSVLITNGDTTDYCAENTANNQWEAGILTRVSSTVYSRVPLRGTNGASPVNFTAAPIVFSTIVADKLHFVSGPCFRAYRASSTQSVASATFVKIQYNAESFDYGSCFDSVTNFRFTPNVPGLYRVDWTMYGAGTTGATGITTELRKNGATQKRGSYASSVANNDGGSVGNDLVAMNGTTDYLEVFAYVTGSAPVVTLGEAFTTFTGRLDRRNA